ncbi:MAG TPA: toll/interleukin-1 receptor domain-containing protein [Rhizomicrobium sp.]
MRHQVFLSYTHRDKTLVAAVERELKKLGVTAFNPGGDIKPGEDWRKSVMKAIKLSDLVVVFLADPTTVASSWIGYEVGSASALGKDVVVMKPSSFSVGDLPSDLAGWRTLDFDPARPAKTAKALASSLVIAG